MIGYATWTSLLCLSSGFLFFYGFLLLVSLGAGKSLKSQIKGAAKNVCHVAENSLNILRD